MAKYNNLPVFKLSYALVLEIYKATHQFSREYKYSLGQKIKNLSMDLIDSIVTANSVNDKKRPIEEALVVLERLRIHLRLASDLKIYGKKRYEMQNKLIEEIMSQLGGWLKWQKAKT